MAAAGTLAFACCAGAAIGAPAAARRRHRRRPLPRVLAAELPPHPADREDGDRRRPRSRRAPSPRDTRRGRQHAVHRLPIDDREDPARIRDRARTSRGHAGDVPLSRRRRRPVSDGETVGYRRQDGDASWPIWPSRRTRGPRCRCRSATAGGPRRRRGCASAASSARSRTCSSGSTSLACQRYIDSGSAWILSRAEAGGGALLNLGIHGFDVFRYITGEEPKVVAAVTSHAPAAPRDRRLRARHAPHAERHRLPQRSQLHVPATAPIRSARSRRRKPSCGDDRRWRGRPDRGAGRDETITAPDGYLAAGLAWSTSASIGSAAANRRADRA